MPRSSILLALGAASVLAASMGTVHAQPIPIANAGFESPVVADGTFQVLVPTGWQVYDPGGIVDQMSNAVGLIRPNVPQLYFPGGAPEGAQAALVFMGGGVNGPAGLQQTLGATLVANTVYTLRVEIGNIGSDVSLPGSSDGGGTFYNLAGFPGYRIEFLAGSMVLGSDSVSAGAIPEGGWSTATLIVDSTPFAALVGQSLQVRLVNLDIPGTPSAPAIEVDFDDVRLTAAPVPEPATVAMWLAGLALTAMGVMRRRTAVPLG